MKGKCIVKLIGNGDEQVILFLKDYIQHSNVKEARELTDTAFTRNKDFIDSHDYNGYKVTWSWYDLIYKTFSDFIEIMPLIRVIETYEFDSITLTDFPRKYSKILDMFFFESNIQFKSNLSLLSLKEFIFNLVLLIFSLCSIFFVSFKRGRRVAIRTEDYIFKNTKSDFRLNHLYDKYEQNSVLYIEFIRSTKIKNFFVNAYKRRRFAIYYTAIIFFVDLLTKKTQYSKQPKDFYQSVLHSYHRSNIVLKRSVLVIEKILKILRIDKFVLISFSSRSAHLALAAKTLGIPTIGIMHGLQQKEYAVYEFMESYSEDKKIGCDLYGVWSPEYLHYFRRFSKIMHPESIQYSGLLRPKITKLAFQPFKRISSKKVRILLISEPLVSATEIAPFIEKLQLYNDIEIAIKVRPMIKDSYYEELLQLLPSIKRLKVYDGKIEVDGAEFDIFLGSNSTAVIEASLLDKISILVMTKKWGDYFDLNNLIEGCSLVVEHPDMLYDHILERIENESELKSISKIRRKFFGDNKDGAQWLVDQL